MVLDVAGEARLDGRDVERPGQLVAVEGQPRLGARGVTGRQPRRLHPEGTPCFQDRLPQPENVVGVDKDLVPPLLAAVTGAGHH